MTKKEMKHEHKKTIRKPKVKNLMIEFVYAQLLELKQEVVVLRENLNKLMEEKAQQSE